MSDGVVQMLRAGAADGSVAQFRAVIEGVRFTGTQVGNRLAKILTGRKTFGSGSNRDTPVLELCHLTAMAAALGYDDRNARFRFFLDMDDEKRSSPAEARRVTPAAVRHRIEKRHTDRGWSRDDCELTERGMRAVYGSETHEVWFDRIPVLMAFFEFLIGIDDATFFAEMDDLLQTMITPPVTLRGIKDASNRLAARMRLWRRSNIAWATHEERFDKIAPYLSERGPEGNWVIDDEAIFGFWVLHSNAEKKPIREYATVFEAFVNLSKVMRAAEAAQAGSDARRLGTDFEAGDIDVADDIGPMSGEWETPLAIFDHPDLKSIRFFKGDSERAPIERLMQYGPDAQRLARAFLRLESFAPTQNVISNAIRFKRGKAIISNSVACVGTTNYQAYQEDMERVLEHIRRLQLAVVHVLRRDVDDDVYAPISEDSRAAFQDLRRKGFDDDDPDEDRRDAFRMAANALPSVAGQLRGLLEQISDLEKDERDLALIFNEDVSLFSKQFRAIYGDRQ